MSESTLLRHIQLALTGAGCRVMRNNVGNGYLGEFVTVLPNGDVVLRNWRRVQFGLAPGSSDLIGWHPLLIGPEHVDRTVAVFTSVEVKTPRGRAAPEQRAWLDAVREAGGIAVLARSQDEAVEFVLSST